MELRNSYPDDFKNLLRVSEDQFDFLLERVSPLVAKSDTKAAFPRGVTR
jgi:hypothetical protein